MANEAKSEDVISLVITSLLEAKKLGDKISEKGSEAISAYRESVTKPESPQEWAASEASFADAGSFTARETSSRYTATTQSTATKSIIYGESIADVLRRTASHLEIRDLTPTAVSTTMWFDSDGVWKGYQSIIVD